MDDLHLRRTAKPVAFRQCTVCDQTGRFGVQPDDDGRLWHVKPDPKNRDESVFCGLVIEMRALAGRNRQPQKSRVWTPPRDFYAKQDRAQARQAATDSRETLAQTSADINRLLRELREDEQ